MRELKGKLTGKEEFLTVGEFSALKGRRGKGGISRHWKGGGGGFLDFPDSDLITLNVLSPGRKPVNRKYYYISDLGH